MTAPTRAWPLAQTPTPAPRVYPGAAQAAQALARTDNPAAVIRALVQSHSLHAAQRILDEMQTELAIAARATHNQRPSP